MHRTWNEHDDHILRSAVKKHSYLTDVNWDSVTKYFPTKSKKQCKERYVNYAKITNVNKTKLSMGEYHELYWLAHTYNNKWSQIVKFFPGRSPNQLKNAWHSRRRKGVVRSNLSVLYKIALEYDD
jgi:Myb-like DNA-binding protein FlbD